MMQSTRTTRGADQRETSQTSRLTRNSSTGSKRSEGGSAPQGTFPNRQSSWLRWLILIIVLNLLFYAPPLFSSASAGPTITRLTKAGVRADCQRRTEVAFRSWFGCSQPKKKFTKNDDAAFPPTA
jgi:hypothetical protein